MSTNVDDSPKGKRVILYCRACKWAGDVTDSGVSGRCPDCKALGLSYVAFHQHEKEQANGVLMMDIGKTVDDVKPYEET